MNRSVKLVGKFNGKLHAQTIINLRVVERKVVVAQKKIEVKFCVHFKNYPNNIFFYNNTLRNFEKEKKKIYKIVSIKRIKDFTNSFFYFFF